MQMTERLLKVLCALALVVNVLIPAGFMLARAQTGDEITILICTGNGPQTLTLDSDGHQIPAKNDQNDDKRCDFAKSGALASASDAPARLATAVRYAAVIYRVSREVHRATPKPGAVSARGPPIELI
jgi:hypothetical protein